MQICAHLQAERIRQFDRQKIVSAIEKYLTFSPTKESRSRIKRLEQPMWAEYRLRVDGFRVYYNVFEDRGVVEILRIIWKDTGHTPEEPPL